MILYDPTEAADSESGWPEKVAVVAPSVKRLGHPSNTHNSKAEVKQCLRTEQKDKEEPSPVKAQKVHPIPRGPRDMGYLSHEKARVCLSWHHEYAQERQRMKDK